MNRTVTRKLAKLALVAFLAVPVLPQFTARKAVASVLPVQTYQYNFAKTLKPFGCAEDRDQRLTNIAIQKPFDILSLQGTEKDGYARLTNNGANAVWMQTNYQATATYLFLRFEVTGLENADRLAPIIYVGAKAPDALYQFQKMGEPLAMGRQTLYTQLDLEEAGLLGNEIYVAIGFMNLDQTQEAQSALVDNVAVRIHYGD